MDFSAKDIFQYGGYIVAIAASWFAIKTQNRTLAQENEMQKFMLSVRIRLQEYEMQTDRRLDKVEEQIIVGDKDNRCKIEVLEAKTTSASGWIGLLYKKLLLDLPNTLMEEQIDFDKHQ